MPSAAAEADPKLGALIGADRVARFVATLRTLGCGDEDRLAVAVSGGADSSALLLLAAAARPGGIVAATVDHGLRAEAAAEARAVAALCGRLGVPHTTLAVTVAPGGGPQAASRRARYDALGAWCPAPWLLTGHQRDDVAEAILMRLARGAGVRGLARMPDARPLAGRRATLLRPLLDWSRAELLAVCAGVEVQPVDDPSNADMRFDRARARRLLARTPWLAPERLARAADNLAEADIALEWFFEREWEARVNAEDAVDFLLVDAEGLPHDTRRRFAERAIGWFAGRNVPRDRIESFVDRLVAGSRATLAGVKASPGPPWRFELAPPRRCGTPERA